MEIFGITDISSSESDLRRFSIICKFFGIHERTIRPDDIYPRLKQELKNVGLERKSDKVIHRHLNIMRELGILESIEEKFILTSDGKVLFELVKEKQITELTIEEKIFYLKMFFTSRAQKQLLILLKRVEANKEKEKIIFNYFTDSYIQQLWDKNTIETNLRKYNESGKFSSFFNKYDCMISWLEQLGLLSKVAPRTVVLTSIGKVFLSDFNKFDEEVDSEIYHISKCLFFNDRNFSKIVPFNYDLHAQDFIESFKKAYELFRIDDGSDIQAIKTYMGIIFLTNFIIINENEFYYTVQQLNTIGIVKSIYKGIDGKPVIIKRF